MTLVQFQNLLNLAEQNPDSPISFLKAVQAALDLKIFPTPREFGHRFGVGTSQVIRWGLGVSRPLLPMRKTILRELRVKTLESRPFGLAIDLESRRG